MPGQTECRVRRGVLNRRTQAFKCFLKQLTCFFLLGGVHSPRVDIDGQVRQANGKRLTVIGHCLKIVDDAVRGYRIGKPLNPDPSDLLTADLVFYVRIGFIGDQDFSRGRLALSNVKPSLRHCQRRCS